jgi:hypothetical protein
MPTLPAHVKELISKQAITEQIYAYCRAMDRNDAALARSIWHDNGRADYGPIFTGSGSGFVDFVMKSHEGKVGLSHQVTNILIRVSGARAASESYVTAALRSDRENVLYELVVRGRYVDLWSQRSGRWALDLRRYLLDMEDTRAIQAGRAPSGRHDESDPSYTAFAALS